MGRCLGFAFLCAWSTVILARVALPRSPADRNVEQYNYILGTQTIGSKYRFTNEDVLVETSRAILQMGSNILKISLEQNYAKQYEGIASDPRIRSPLDLVRDLSSFRAVLQMPLSHILLWVYPFDAGWWADGLSPDESEKTYRQMYDLTTYLLRTFQGTGKTFYLGHWEGDWHLHPSYDPSKDPSEKAVQGMQDWLNVRQRAIEDAKRAVKHRQVEVYGYTEVNLVQKAMRGGKTLTNDVLPHTTVDFVSYSSYDSLTNDPATVGDRLKTALDYIEARLHRKPGIQGRRVFIGEYGFPRQYHTPEKQAELSRAVGRAAIEWGCRFALYWEMYCNEKVDGKHRGFWMIDDQGVKQPVYNLHERYYRDAKRSVAGFQRRYGRLPREDEFRKMALSLLR